VELSQPDVELWIVLDYSKSKESAIVDLPVLPCYFGRLIGRGGLKEELRKYDLKKRLYLGPTSLDPALALIMSNLADVRPGMVAFDPFVGTASILVALSHFGAMCFGADIDTRVLRGEMYAGAADKTVDLRKRDIFENFKEYGLAVPELIRMDNHVFDRHISMCVDSVIPISEGEGKNTGKSKDKSKGVGHCENEGDSMQTDTLSSEPEVVVEGGMFDVIVTDPPYGIRAGAKKSGTSRVDKCTSRVAVYVTATCIVWHLSSLEYFVFALISY
jgi:tRNA G10  N-methylase Trm11